MKPFWLTLAGMHGGVCVALCDMHMFVVTCIYLSSQGQVWGPRPRGESANAGGRPRGV